ncbi:heterokaryon incompatibility protein-domain-containing protein [Cercophora scortea]|uniref:Heterokaryon incompatibility protein-domain-containing protein n=1 Tax=Cercophora scortea TaxID=314031 RepID=A0AAE0IDJ4_9PEZI|nr:heterokaryon incompatibility protein-domain-containing protein [Cercophora scortea]
MATDICDECRRMAAWICESNSEMVGEKNIWQDSNPSNEFPRSGRHPLVLESAAPGCRSCVLIHRAASQRMAIAIDPYVMRTIQGKEISTGLAIKTEYAELQTPGSEIKQGKVLDRLILRSSSAYLHENLAEFGVRTMQTSAAIHSSVNNRLNARSPDLDLVSQWVKHCADNHSSCLATTGAGGGPPSRLLHIAGPKLCLVDWGEKRGPCQYIALSYCWGMVHPIKTTRASVASHRQGVDIESLPRTFRDVITVAQKLHVSYIWIDSLCIIQDDVQDWEAECPRMGDVYRNAFLVVAASDATDSTVGFLHSYCDHSLDSGQVVSLPCPKCSASRPNLEAEATSFFIEALPANPLTIRPQDKPRHLATRGWAFQERLLASRYLSVSSRNMEWECGECVQKDELHHPRSHSTWPDRKANYKLTRRLPGSEDDVIWDHELHEDWLRILCVYSSCNLTHSSDRLPAFSGTAQLFSSQFSVRGRYLAGIWEQWFLPDLLWSRSRSDILKTMSRKEPSSGISSAVYPQRAQDPSPSWSWVSVTFPIEHPTVDLSAYVFHSAVLDCQTDLRGIDPFGRVQGGRLTMNGWIAPVQLQPPRPGYKEETMMGGVWCYRKDASKVMRAGIKLDGPLPVLASESSESSELFLFLMAEVKSPGGYRVKPDWYALALQKISSDGAMDRSKPVYKRIGLVQVFSPRFERYGARDWFSFKEADKATVEIL